MAKIIEYSIISSMIENGVYVEKYLQSIVANENYCRSGRAPTMGARHSFCEYKTIWGDEPKYFEPLTLSNYIRIIFEENRWETKTIKRFIVTQRCDDM